MKPSTAKFILTRVLGWKPDPAFPTAKKALVLGVPHTSIWDFVVAYLYARSNNAPMHILVKENFFFWPVGPVISKWGYNCFLVTFNEQGIFFHVSCHHWS